MKFLNLLPIVVIIEFASIQACYGDDLLPKTDVEGTKKPLW